MPSLAHCPRLSEPVDITSGLVILVIEGYEIRCCFGLDECPVVEGLALPFDNSSLLIDVRDCCPDVSHRVWADALYVTVSKFCSLGGGEHASTGLGIDGIHDHVLKESTDRTVIVIRAAILGID